MMKSRFAILLALALTVLAIGCSRTRYRLAADRDTQRVLREKAACAALDIPNSYAVTPDPRSRFYDSTNPDCPQLPVQRPVLYGYDIPELATKRSQGQSDTASLSQPTSTQTPNLLPETSVAAEIPPPPVPLPSITPIELPVFQASFVVQPVNESVEAAQVNQTEDGPAKPTTSAPTSATSNYKPAIAKVSIPQDAWNVLPKSCIDRMLEFETLRFERTQSFPKDSFELPQVDHKSLNLENLMELATINSREYQTRKEILYRTALAVTRQRYQFELNPTQFGNGTAANYRHLRNNGTTVNTLGVPTGLGVQQTLATGGEFLARFANSVVLTFNGPSGFATDIGSDLIFDFQQTIFQRDVRFENLTQTERDVVYATRDYVRFRKQLFRDIANLYYNLLLNYRSVEINAQDYFTNLRGFLQAQAEYRTAEKIPRIQVDQFEQSVLRTRSNLVGNCFALEAALDQLKFRLGLPPELPIYLDLAELRSISLRDEFAVARQMISRSRTELLNARQSQIADATSLANVAEVLAKRMMDILRIQQRMQAFDGSGSNPTDGSQPWLEVQESFQRVIADLEDHQRRLQILGARLQVDILRKDLDLQIKADLPVPPLRILIRAIDFCHAEAQVIDKAIEMLSQHNGEEGAVAPLIAKRNELQQQLIKLISFIEEISSRVSTEALLEDGGGFQLIPERMKESVELVRSMEKLALDATRDILPESSEAVEAQIEATVSQTIELSDELMVNGPTGWEEIKLDNNEALLTGLVQRLDLMNQRGDLADAWRQIKLAGDDLRSIVDLRATQVLRTRNGDDDPFDFTFENSETRLSAALDTPLNRRLQRNNFRIALINYNVGLRNLMAAEDTIKLDVREDLRQLQLDRNQYTIAVASAALAFERVISTQLRLQLGVANVAARDFLESQQAYTNALLTIARTHVNYITDRLELFFDLEAFDVTSLGYWDGVGQDYGPQINVDFPATNPHPYDCLPGRVWYSPTVRQMESIPPGEAIINTPQ
jgi:Outer membrane efflux protein